jgi:hypothetical protein
MTEAQPRTSGRRAFDKTVSSKRLAFAADAAAMGIDCCFGTRVQLGEHLSADSIDPRGGRWLVAGSDWEHCHRHFWERDECRHTSSVSDQPM